MGFLVLLFLLVISSSTLAFTEVTSAIYDIDYGAPGEEPLVLLTNGKVLRASLMQRSLIKLETAKSNRTLLRLVVDSSRTIHAFERLPYEHKKNEVSETTRTYFASVLADMEEANRIFREARYKNKDSQCFNRAHVWSYEWFTKHQLFSSKTWIFFTRKYIRKFAFEWWFHVAPSSMVFEDGQARHKVMDVKYARTPLETKRWTDIFMRNDATCPLIKSYSEYANYPESGSCFVMRTSMFYYQPYDIEVLETWGNQRGNWLEDDLKQAFLDALDETI
jgi:hypothetical protein